MTPRPDRPNLADAREMLVVVPAPEFSGVGRALRCAYGLARQVPPSDFEALLAQLK